MVYQKTVNSVVTIETDKALGSGFFISNDLVATNFHVIQNASYAYIFLNSSDKSFEVEGYVAKDEANDLVILKVKYSKGIALHFASRPVKQGEDILAIGSPKGIPATISKGIVSNLNSAAKLIQIDASISQGSSGGPVLNMNGEVIGVAVGAIENGQNLNFAIPVKLLENLLSFKSSYSKKFDSSSNENSSRASGSTTESADRMLISFSNGTSISKEDFLKVYYKNNKDALTKKGFEDYLQLFINFHFKVFQAEELELDKTESFKKEISGYAEQLKNLYRYNQDNIEKMVQEAYQREKYVIRAQHILVSVGSVALPEDTLAAYSKILEIRKRIIEGEDFAQMAKKYSDDPSAKDNGGDLGYFTILQMVYQFETVAYKTNIGEISFPVRTRFGYHIIKVIDKKTNPGEVRVKQIMIRGKQNETSKRDLEKAKERIDVIYGKIKSGEQFEDLVTRYSEDDSSKNKGGELPIFGIGKMVPEFERAAFSLNSIGEISAPFQTAYGWHIIKLMEKKGILSYEEEKIKLRGKILNDSRVNSLKRLNDSEVENNSEYKALVDEYRDGILLFDLTDKKVWSKAVNNETGLSDFYSKNKEHYQNRSFEEAKKEVIADYQSLLEKEWIKDLRRIYSYKINEKVYNKILESLD